MSQKKLFSNLVSTLLEIKTEVEMINFLEGILTIKELEELPMRLEIVKRLLQNEPQHKIAEELGLGVATVTRGSKELKLGRFKFLVDKSKND